MKLYVITYKRPDQGRGYVAITRDKAHALASARHWRRFGYEARVDRVAKKDLDDFIWDPDMRGKGRDPADAIRERRRRGDRHGSQKNEH